MYEIGEVEQIITPDGITYSLEDSAIRAISAIGGRGMPGVAYESYRGYQQPFPVVVGWTLEPRTVTLRLVFNPTTRSEYWELRAELIQALRFNRGGPFTLRHIRADGTRRDLLCFVNNTPVFPDDALAWDSYEVDVELVAFDPLFKDATSLTHTTAFSVIDDLLLPATFPILFRPEEYADIISLTYAGTFVAYPYIEINGPYTWLVMQHIQTGAALGLTVPIALGEQRIIDLTPREQSITDGSGNDKFGELIMPLSNLITFNLRPEGQPWRNSAFEGVPNGLNQIWLRAEGVTSDTRISFVYRQQYLDLA